VRRRFLSGLTIALLLAAPSTAFAAAAAVKRSAPKPTASKPTAVKRTPTPQTATTTSPLVPQVPATGGLGSGVTPVSPVPTTTSTTPTVVTNSSTTGGSSLSGGSVFGIAAGAVVVLVGISFFIWRDARRRAPARGGSATPAAERIPGSKRVKPRKLSPAERRRRKRGRARR
jgi:hypothetical protein